MAARPVLYGAWAPALRLPERAAGPSPATTPEGGGRAPEPACAERARYGIRGFRRPAAVTLPADRPAQRALPFRPAFRPFLISRPMRFRSRCNVRSKIIDSLVLRFVETYRISLRSSTLREPRYPSLKFVTIDNLSVVSAVLFRARGREPCGDPPPASTKRPYQKNKVDSELPG